MKSFSICICEGVKVLFRVGLVLLKVSLEGQENLSQCPTFYETLEKLRLKKLSPELQDEEFILREVSTRCFDDVLPQNKERLGL